MLALRVLWEKREVTMDENVRGDGVVGVAEALVVVTGASEGLFG